MPSFAELRERAEKAKDAGVSKFQNTRDRHSSVPLKNTNWDPYSGKPPPPPPPQMRSGTSAIHSPRSSISAHPTPPPPQRAGSIMSHSSSSSFSSTPPPPAVRHASRPALPHRQSSEQRIDWANLSQEDKEAFFGLLDEYFSRSFGISVPQPPNYS
ncbi:hypothetical protein CYLTODRAFT_426589 [Cylindrobasidium torrendii FP15055 ss-10]|uniref:Uncharacterized protein n=1 Tax=Cylindrobasidium torrendii FP15055 ss-10 TaxID=1314674 RepID=A0A0D7AY15_9AGAR|nr:hypothetical protein CYLTODRAFT_426589 [Cylindrobasidium torrendii FP15055 ss-10]